MDYEIEFPSRSADVEKWSPEISPSSNSNTSKHPINVDPEIVFRMLLTGIVQLKGKLDYRA